MSDIVKFHDVEFEIIELDGEKSVRVSALAKALGYANGGRLVNLINRRRTEFEGKRFFLNLGINPSGGRPEMVLTYNGVIRAAMLSNAPRAKEFRDWAEEVLFKVMTTGHYELPGVSVPTDPMVIDALARLNEGMLFLSKQMENIRFSKLIASEPDISQWFTPGQRIKRLEELAGRKVRRFFNRGGGFDRYVNQEHHKQFGGGLRMRFRRYIAKEPEFVLEPCPEMDRFLRDSYRKYTIFYNPDNQPRLRLTGRKARLSHAER